MSEKLSRLDLADEEVRADAAHELRRAEAAGVVALAAWARKWACPAMDALNQVSNVKWRELGEIDG